MYALMYPSLEDMKVDQIMSAQTYSASAPVPEPSHCSETSYGIPRQFPTAPPESPRSNVILSVYPSLMDEYMGLHLEPPSGPVQSSPPNNSSALLPRQQMPVVQVVTSLDGGWNLGMVAPLSGTDLGLRRAHVTNGIRELELCKDGNGKIGLRVCAVNGGVFVQFVMKESVAALVGLRVGDQILQINGENVSGSSAEKAMNILKKAPGNKIVLACRDRPFERTITLHKNSAGNVGFQFSKTGKITAIVKDSSAARNGLLIDHQIMEVNGQNVMGMKDNELMDIFNRIPQIVTLTVMPSYVYDHMMKCMSDSLVKRLMDHSVPDV